MNQTTESSGPGPLYQWYEENRDISDSFIEDCLELPETPDAGFQLQRVYNQLEIYNYDKSNDKWMGPDVYFSPVRSHGYDHTKTFDSFWLDSLDFEVTFCITLCSKYTKYFLV